MKMLVHICCSVDSHYFLQRLKNDFQQELIAFFYDPNIHPYSEYQLRLLDVKRSCKSLSIELIEGEYNYDGWLSLVKGLENEPEKGKRCSVCFDDRLRVSAKKARELGIKKVTTTLLTSPKKSFEQLKASGERVCAEFDREFVFVDYRSSGGTQKQFELAKKDKLYKQNYCGCLFALQKQREVNQKLADELFSPINKQVLPNSIEEKIELYSKIIELKNFEIVKNRFLNYRLLSGVVKINQEAITSYILAYSKMRKNFTKATIEINVNGIYYLNKDEVKLLNLEKFNELAKTNFKSVKELLFNPIKFEDELKVREKITNLAYDLSSIIILDEVKEAKYEISLNAKTYEDIKISVVNHKFFC